jgi:hypothetical protein
VHDTAADAVRPAEQPRGGLDVAGEQKVADARRAHDHAVDLDRRDDVNCESVALPTRSELLDIALGPAAEVEIRTHDDPPYLARAAHAIDELVGGKPGEGLVEAEHHDRIGAGFAQAPDAFAYVGES